jgi:hypothetical protein
VGSAAASRGFLSELNLERSFENSLGVTPGLFCFRDVIGQFPRLSFSGKASWTMESGQQKLSVTIRSVILS